MARHAGKHASGTFDSSSSFGNHQASSSPDNQRIADYQQMSFKQPKKQKRLVPVLVGIFVILALAFIGYQALLIMESSHGNSMTSEDEFQLFAPSDTLHDDQYLPTPIMAESAGVQLHCAVRANNLTEILIHNASYDYAQPITTKLTEATNTTVIENHGTGRIASTQPTGNKWMTGEFIRCYRPGNAGPAMSSIDCGAAAGTDVFAPVSGKVVFVKEYDLYDNPNYKDIRVHIQPEGKNNLDVVLIHLTDVTVKQGDTVVAGETKIGKIRDVFAYIGSEMQLRDYTAEGDNGNHTHIAVNDKTNPNYHGLDDLKS